MKHIKIKKIKHKFLKKIIIILIKFFSVVLAVCIVILCILYIHYKVSLPDIDTIISQNNKQSVSILYSNNINKIRSYNNSSINNLTFSDLPIHLVNALVATEDRNFFKHKGIDFLGLFRAFFVNIKSGHIKQGGSTITQQLSKMILKDNSKTIKRKFKEFILTRELEKYLTKEDIIVLYLTKSYFGAGNYGIREASKYYFGKEVEDLKLDECAMLVGLLKAPTKYNPSKNKDLTESRTTQVIINMKNAGFIDENDILDYIVPDLDLNFYKQYRKYSQNYYFADWIYKQLQDFNIDKNSTNVIVESTLNNYIQNKTIDIVNNFVKNNSKQIENSELAVVILNKNGEIIAMIGGKDYNKSQFNRVIYANRQTGSTFKFFVYLTGFENGLEPNDIFIDEPIKIGNWYPENVNYKYRGEMSVKDAFCFSSNSIAVQIVNYFGVKKVMEIAKKLGLNNKFKRDLTISLGTQENNLLEMTAAYATIINKGIPIFPYGIKSIISNGKLIYKKNIIQKEPVLKNSSVENMQYLLYSVIKDGTGRAAKVEDLINKSEVYNLLHIDKKYFIGGKSGSTQDYRDAWFIGFANNYLIGVWFGNDDNKPTNKIMGGNLPAKLWKEIVSDVLLNNESN